jgi:hypothetical protein
MKKMRLIGGLLVFGLLAGGQMQAQTVAPGPPLYYTGSSATVSSNTLDRVATNGTARTTLLTASGPDLNKINRCTAVAVDGLNGKLFFVDDLATALWSVNIDGTGLVEIKAGLTNYPTDLALDVLNEQIYYTSSSTIQGNNTIQRLDYTGSNSVTLFTAGGGTGVARCTAIALDRVHSKMFVADAGTNKIWSLSLAGTGLTQVASATNLAPTDLAVDVTNQLVYFTLSSPVQSSNRIQRVSYAGTGLTTMFTASGSVQRCTALDLDIPNATIYLSDAGNASPALWRLPLGGGGATLVYSGLPAVAKKVRWYSGVNNRPAPGFASIHLAGTNVVLNATNGFVGGTYYVLTSTNLATPLSQWLSVSTNVLGATGNFVLNATNANLPHQFFLLRVK